MQVSDQRTGAGRRLRIGAIVLSLLVGLLTLTPVAAGAAMGAAAGTGKVTAQATLGNGYFFVATDGGIFNFGDSEFKGSTGAIALNRPIVGAAPTRTGEGYWLVASDGGIFTFGDARFLGSTGAISLNSPIVAMAATPSGNGYWLFAADGGVFTFGDAPFLGSAGAVPLNRPIVGADASPDGGGYWLVASDGGIFTYGNAPFVGSTGATALNRPIVGMSATNSGQGYYLVASDGGIFSFGDANFLGSTGAIALNQPIVGMAVTSVGQGYYLVASDGGIFSFGNAAFLGSTGNLRLNRPVVGMAVTPFSPPQLVVSSQDDFLQLPSRLVFSTVAGAPTPAKTLSLRNTGVSAVSVTGLAFGGPGAGAYSLGAGQSSTFTVAPGATATVRVRFTPQAPANVNDAALVITSSDLNRPTIFFPLGGVNPVAAEGDAEPNLNEIVHALGYGTNVGPIGRPQSEGGANSLGNSPLPVGDEVPAAYWTRFNPAAPVQLIPLARYTGLFINGRDEGGWYERGNPDGKTAIYTFPSDTQAGFTESQKLFPGYDGTTAFDPPGQFGLWGNGIAFSDDALSGGIHSLRSYPAKRADGSVIPHVYIVGLDARTFGANFDYQDQVMIVINADPIG